MSFNVPKSLDSLSTFLRKTQDLIKGQQNLKALRNSSTAMMVKFYLRIVCVQTDENWSFKSAQQLPGFT